jgi:tRNA(Ile)-lysidine synthase
LIEEKKEYPKPALITRIVKVEDPMQWLANQPKSPHIAYFDSDAVSQPLTLRHPQRGERFQPFGMNGKSRLISDYLTDLHLSVFEKRRTLVLCQSDGTILWLAGYRPDAHFCVTSSTHSTLIITLEIQE